MHMCMHVGECVYVNHLSVFVCACNLGIDVCVCVMAVCVCVCWRGAVVGRVGV